VPAGRTVTSDPPNVLEYEWLHDGSPAGTVRWEIVSDTKLGVRVELTQTAPSDMLPLAMASWHVYLDRFFATVMGSETGPWPQDQVTKLTKHYKSAMP